MEITEAFTLLKNALRQMQDEGGQPVAAAVKNRMLRLTDRTFSEGELAFPSFRAFLQAAEAAGIVSLAQSAGGDLAVLLPGQPRIAPGPRRMRRDFWNAFIKWDDGNARLYDKDADRILYVDTAAGELLTTNSPDRYVPIPAPARAETVQAMRDLLERVPAEDRTHLEEILGGADNVEKKFVEALPPEAKAAWRATAAWQVMSRAEAWRANNGLDVDLHTAVVAPGPTSSATRAYRGACANDRREEAIRRRVVSAVERMPLSAVLQLPIPVEYLLVDGAL